MSERNESLADRYRRVRAASESLCAPLSVEDCGLQSMPLASPPKWHLAHTSWFFETVVLASEAEDYPCFHPEFRYLFNSYYNAVGPQFPQARRGLLSRPALHEVIAYREHVDLHLMRLLETSLPDSAIHLIELGIHHEQQHQELILTDVKHALAQNPLRPAYDDALAQPPAGDPGPLGWRSHPGGTRELGAAEGGFAFDNERPRHRVLVEPFQIAARPVTNADYLAFIEDGGYENPGPWLADGFDQARREGWQSPLYWERRDGEWFTRTLGGPRRVEPCEPVCHVSYFEADAFARWAGARLPNEVEWEVAAAGTPVEGNFVESGLLHPAPGAKSGNGPTQLFGDVWEWTRSPYGPYPGFRPMAGAVSEYNGKFMSGQMVLRGGSCATPRSHIRASYRNFFHPAARWQFSGIRLARD